MSLIRAAFIAVRLAVGAGPGDRDKEAPRANLLPSKMCAWQKDCPAWIGEELA